MKTFKIRSSASGQIVGQPRLKAEKEAGMLSKTAKTFCKNWLKEYLYKRRIEFTSKYTEKGNIVEDNSIDFVAKYLGFGMLLKNNQYFENEFITGTPDIVLPDLVIDVKNSWDFSTFPIFETEIPNKDYYWQLQSYMALTGKDKAQLIYTLLDTPLHLIEKEAFWYAKNNGYGELTEEIYDKFLQRMTFGNIPDNLKIKVFEIERNNYDIDKIENQVIKCRNYIETLKY